MVGRAGVRGLDDSRRGREQSLVPPDAELYESRIRELGWRAARRRGDPLGRAGDTVLRQEERLVFEIGLWVNLTWNSP